MVDLGIFLAPIAGLSPAGTELRNDGRFHAIERLLEPTSRSAHIAKAENGGSGAIEVDWHGIIEQSAVLAAEGRDLRLVVVVARSLANAHGFSGLADGLDLLSQTIVDHWDNLHPALRDGPTRGEAAKRRINALYQLENADNGLLCDIEFTPFITLRVVGAITGGDLSDGTQSALAALASAPGISEKEKPALLAAHEARANRVRSGVRAYANEQSDAMAALIASVVRARTSLSALEAALDSRVAENGIGIKFAKLGSMLGRIFETLNGHQDRLGPRNASAVGGLPMNLEPSVALNGTDQLTNGQVTHGDAALPVRVNSRQDVERCLDMIIDFYERTEPSSPIPHLAQRMRKMVPMNFVQLMEEIAPSGMKEFRNLAGSIDAKSQ